MSVPESPAPPLGLRERILAASLGIRPAGRATPVPEPIDAVEGFRRAASSFGGLLDDLGDLDWRRPALRGLDVQELIGHLIGVEGDVRRALSGDPAVAHLDHVADTQATVDRQRRRTGEQTRRDWTDAVARTIEAAATADQRAVVAVHGVRLPAASLCVARTFELWTHGNDIRRATGRPAADPDASTVTLMTHSRSDSARRGQPDGSGRRRVSRLVLTGPGGGTWQVPLGDGPGPQTVRGRRTPRGRHGSASWPTRCRSAGSSPTGFRPPTWSVTSPATQPSPSPSWRPPGRWRWTTGGQASTWTASVLPRPSQYASR